MDQRVDKVATIDCGGSPLCADFINDAIELAHQAFGDNALPFLLRVSPRTYRVMKAALAHHLTEDPVIKTEAFVGVLCAPVILVSPPGAHGERMMDGIIVGYMDVCDEGLVVCVEGFSVEPSDYPMYR